MTKGNCHRFGYTPEIERLCLLIRLSLVTPNESEEPRIITWALTYPHVLIRLLAQHTRDELTGSRWRVTAHTAIENAIKEWHKGERLADH